MVAKAAKRDRKAYQAAYYQRNKKSLNARRTAARRKIQAEGCGEADRRKGGQGD